MKGIWAMLRYLFPPRGLNHGVIFVLDYRGPQHCLCYLPHNAINCSLCKSHISMNFAYKLSRRDLIIESIKLHPSPLLLTLPSPTRRGFEELTRPQLNNQTFSSNILERFRNGRNDHPTMFILHLPLAVF